MHLQEYCRGDGFVATSAVPDNLNVILFPHGLIALRTKRAYVELVDGGDCEHDCEDVAEGGFPHTNELDVYSTRWQHRDDHDGRRTFHAEIEKAMSSSRCFV